MKYSHSFFYRSSNVCVDLIFVSNFSFFKRNIWSAGREKEQGMWGARGMALAVVDETKGPSSSECSP